MVQNSNVAPFKMSFIGSLIGAWAQGANETDADINPLRNFAQIGYNQYNSSLTARRQWEYYQKQAELDHQYNLQTMDHAAEIARDQYDYEYKMESPAARVLQLQQAGLNKGLMYGSGAPGMQGSVSSGTPVSTRGNMPNLKESFNKPSAAAIGSALSAMGQQKVYDSEADKNAAIAEYYRAEAANKRGETDPSKAEMKLKNALAEESEGRKALDAVHKELLDIEKEVDNTPIRVEYTSEDGRQEAFETTGKFLSLFHNAAIVAKAMYDSDMSRIERDSYAEYLRAEINNLVAQATEAGSSANLTEVRKRYENFLNGIAYNLERTDALVSEDMRGRLTAAIEKSRRYMAKEFDGSTTEWINEVTKPLYGAMELATSNMPEVQTTTTTSRPYRNGKKTVVTSQKARRFRIYR